MSRGEPPADFAMLRAAEVLAHLHRLQRGKAVAVQRLAAPAVLRSPRIAFAVGLTLRAHVERELGVAFSYPARGWHTYASNESGRRCFLSAFYKDATLIGVELYVPAVARAPALAALELGGFTLEPVGARIGMDASAALEATFPGGAVYVKAARGSIERIAVYADRSSLV
ncbi:MAG: hypothetical protein ABR508_06825 [Candidatus Baltobacteraceae bacterium]